MESKNLKSGKSTIWLGEVGAEREIRTPEVSHHRFSRPAPWARLSYLRFGALIMLQYIIQPLI